MDLVRITRADLRWWLDLAPTLDWTFAKTYAQTAPHSYVVHGRTIGLDLRDYERAGRVIHTFGEPGKFWSYTNIYLRSEDRSVKWWTMDFDVRATDLINQASTDVEYGPQNAPRTYSGLETEWDEIATEWDRIRDASEDAVVRRQIIEHFGAYAPTTLEIGCGTGTLLDMKVVSPRLYTGIDPSGPMLNQLVRKHPSVRELIAGRLEDAKALTRYELVVAMDVPGVTERDLEQYATRQLIVTGRSKG